MQLQFSHRMRRPTWLVAGIGLLALCTVVLVGVRVILFSPELQPQSPAASARDLDREADHDEAYRRALQYWFSEEARSETRAWIAAQVAEAERRLSRREVSPADNTARLDQLQPAVEQRSASVRGRVDRNEQQLVVNIWGEICFACIHSLP